LNCLPSLPTGMIKSRASQAVQEAPTAQAAEAEIPLRVRRRREVLLTRNM